MPFFSPWSPVFCGTHFVWRQIFLTSRLSALSPSIYWVSQRAGIHNPLGPSDWKHRRKDWVPKSYKECNRKYIYYSHHFLMPLVCRHKYDPKINCYLRISQVMLRKSRWCEKKNPALNHILNVLTSGEMKIRGTGLAKAWQLLFEQRWHDILLTSSPC